MKLLAALADHTAVICTRVLDLTSVAAKIIHGQKEVRVEDLLQLTGLGLDCSTKPGWYLSTAAASDIYLYLYIWLA